MTDRYVDLLKQGFMKPRKARRTAKAKVIVACDRCQDWHVKGKHHKKAG